MNKILSRSSGMRLAVTLMALALCMTAAAQKPYRYDSGHKYSLASNWTVGIAGQYSNYHGRSAVGLSALATKRVGDYWRLRYEASINGLGAVEDFDRYGTAMAGASFDFLNWMYLFADAGAVINPTMATKCGLAADAGLGLNVNFGKHSMLWLEGGSDLVQNNAAWDNTFFARLGYSARLGIIESDRVAIDIDNHIRTTYGEIKEENALLKSEAKKKDEDNARLTDLLERSTTALELATQRLSNCQAEVQQVTQNCINDAFSPILFDYATSFLTHAAEEQVVDLAQAIKSDQSNNIYMIEGYCSANGDPYRNQKLSEERAMTVFLALKSHGVDGTRLMVIGNGMTDRDSVRDQKVVVKRLN